MRFCQSLQRNGIILKLFLARKSRLSTESNFYQFLTKTSVNCLYTLLEVCPEFNFYKMLYFLKHRAQSKNTVNPDI